MRSRGGRMKVSGKEACLGIGRFTNSPTATYYPRGLFSSGYSCLPQMKRHCWSASLPNQCRRSSPSTLQRLSESFIAPRYAASLNFIRQLLTEKYEGSGCQGSRNATVVPEPTEVEPGV